MIRRPRRSLPATLVALLLLAAAVLVALSCVQVLLGRPSLIPLATLAGVGASLTWNTPVVIAGGVIAGVLGLLLLAAAVLPGRPTVLALSGSSAGTSSGVTRRSLCRDLVSTVRSADGITATRISVKRGRIRAMVHAPGGENTELDEQVRGLLTNRLAEIALAHRPRMRVRVRAERRS